MARICRVLGSELVVHVQNVIDKFPQFKNKIRAISNSEILFSVFLMFVLKEKMSVIELCGQTHAKFYLVKLKRKMFWHRLEDNIKT